MLSNEWRLIKRRKTVERASFRRTANALQTAAKPVTSHGARRRLRVRRSASKRADRRGPSAGGAADLA